MMRRYGVLVGCMLVAILLLAGAVRAAGPPGGTAIPGGIVFSDGKEVIYQDFQTGQKISLTADFTGPPIKGPVAISEDGEALIWLFDKKFYLRQIPYGAVSLVEPEKREKCYKNPPVTPGNVWNLTLSPQRTQYAQYAFESTEKDYAWVQVEPGIMINPDLFDSLENRVRNSNWAPHPDDWNKYPKYIQREDTYNAITYCYVRPGGVAKDFRRLGNTARFIPTIPFRTPLRKALLPKREAFLPKLATKDVLLLTTIGNTNLSTNLHLSGKEACQRFSIKRNARFLVWQKAMNWGPSNQMIALIYQTPSGWGPIEIRDVNPNRIINNVDKRKSIKNLKPDVWEISVSLKSCEGLAWKPDGSLTYLTEGKVFSIDSNEIRAGIEKSGVVPDKKILNHLSPVANVFNISGVLVAQGIQGDQLHWVSDDTFLFRGKDKALYCWYQGKKEKLLPSVPEEFSFCDMAPLNFLEVASGKKKLISRLDDFFVGNIKVRWGGYNDKKPPLRIEKNQEGLEYVYPAETNIEDIEDPSRYEFKKPPQVASKESELRVALNQILLLRLNGKYTAIKPVEFKLEDKEKTKMSGRAQDLQWWDTATVEWKHWRVISEKELVKKAPEPSIEVVEKKTAVETGGKASVDLIKRPNNFFSKGFNIGSIKIYRCEWWKLGADIVISQLIPLLEKEVVEEGENLLESALASEPDIADIKDPSRYTYSDSKAKIKIVFAQDQHRKAATGSTVPSAYMLSHRVQLNRILLLKRGNDYAAIKPLEVKTNPDGTGKLIYEWKYWPALPKSK